MLYLKQSTAATIKLGPFVDDSDGKTAETGLTISQADIRLSKNGGDIAQTNNLAGATHDELGYYNVPLDTTDTNTLGTLKVIVSESGALPVFANFMVITAEAYDTLCGTDHFTVDLNGTPSVNVAQISGDSTAADNLESYCDGTTAQPVNVTQIGGTAQSATDLKDFADTGYNPTTHKVQGVVLTDTCTTNTDMRGTDNAYTGTPPTVTAIRQEMDTNSTQLAAILTDTGTTLDGKLDTVAGYLDTEVAAILEDTGTTIPGLINALNNISSGDVSTACGTALDTYDPPTATEMASAFTEIKGATWSSAMDTLEHIRNKQSDIETDTQDLQTQIGTDGAGLTNIPWNSAWDAEVQSECTDALNAYDPPTNAEMNARTLPSASYATAAALSTHDGKLDTVDTVADGIQADLSNATDGLGALKALIDGLNNVSSSDVETACDAAIDNAISSPTANSLGFYMQKMFTALVNKMVVTEASGNTEQFNDSGVSIGTISGAITSDGTYTTRLRMVQ